jgi:hypothetical protein
LFDEPVVGMNPSNSWQFSHQVFAEDRAGLTSASPIIHQGVDHKPEVVGDSWREAGGAAPIERCDWRDRKRRGHSAIVSPVMVDREIRVAASKGWKSQPWRLTVGLSVVTVVADKESSCRSRAF